MCSQLHQSSALLSSQRFRRSNTGHLDGRIDSGQQWDGKRLRSFARNLNTTIEDERAHIAREIHGGLGQAFTGLEVDLTWLAGKIDRAEENIDDPTVSD